MAQVLAEDLSGSSVVVPEALAEMVVHGHLRADADEEQILAETLQEY